MEICYCLNINGKRDDDEENQLLPNKTSSSALSLFKFSLGHEKILSAIFYGVSSFAVIFVNKCVLTDYDFPYFNFLATIQFIVTTIILSILIILKKIEVPMLNLQICREILPISVMFLGNVISGLGSTKTLNLPMLTVLRRFSILMTMIGEFIILGNKATSPVVISVALMIGGAIIAAIYDFSYSSSGYFLVLLNNLFTALNGIWLKKASMSGKCSKLGVLYYNSLFSAVAMIAYFIAEDMYIMNQNHGLTIIGQTTGMELSRHLFNQLPDPSNQRQYFVHSIPVTASINTNEPIKSILRHSTFYNISQYNNWSNVSFVCLFLFASCCGSILNYATFLCTSYNSALTTSVIGCLKNVLTSYIGMIIFPDYHFNWLNFIGVNISIAGSLYYTYVTLFKGVTGFGAG